MQCRSNLFVDFDVNDIGTICILLGMAVARLLARLDSVNVTIATLPVVHVRASQDTHAELLAAFNIYLPPGMAIEL